MNRILAAGVRGLSWSIAGAFALVLAGCSVTELVEEQGRIEYKSAAKLPSLEVPPDLVSPRGDERYAIPDRPQRERTFSGYQTARVAERPAGEVRTLPPVEGVRVERAGTQRWLFVNQPAERLWPVLREFWQESGFLIESEDPPAGLMETNWAENRAKLPQDVIRRTLGRVFDSLYSTGERDRFRTRLETVAGGTEVYISHRGMIEVYTSAEKEATMWQPRPSDPELEAAFLQRLIVKLGADQERAKTMVAGAAPPVAQTATLVGAAPGAQGLEIREGFDRAWRRVGLALDRGGFTVEDRDRSQGMYYVRYIDPEAEAAGKAAKPGFFGRLFSRSASAAPAQQYRVRLAAAGDVTRVTVLSRDGQPLASELDQRTGQRILALLREQLQQ